MTEIPKGIAEQVKEWDLPNDEEKELNEELEQYFTLRKERILKRRKENVNELKNNC